MTRESRPAIKRFIYLLVIFAFSLAGANASMAAQTNLNGGWSKPLVKNPIGTQRIVQTPNRVGIVGQTTKPGGKYPGGTTGGTNQGTTTPGITGGTRRPGGGSGVSIDVNILDIINKPGTRVAPRYPAPRRVYRPRNKTNTARPRPPRRPATPTVVQPIPQFIADQVTVLVRNQPAFVDNALAQTFGLSVLSSTLVALLDGRLVTFRVPQGRQIPRVIAALAADPRITLAQPNNIYLTVQRRARPAPAPVQYSLAKLGLGTAHQIAQGRGVPVAVIDTGVDATHPVLANAVSQSFDAVAESKPRADEHGTAIAGLIAGRGKVTGVAPAARLLAVRAFYMHPQYKRPVTSTDVLIRAFDWSFTSGARIFNMSFAGPFDPLVQATLASAHEKGIILVAAAGNGGPKAPPAYPAAYENVIAITALDQNDKLYAQANRGGYLAAAAPGVDVIVPSLKKGYKFSSGTSMAAAHVSGLVALLLEKNPQATADEVRDIIQATAHDLGPKGHDVQFGAGRADAHASLQSIPASEVKVSVGQ